MTAEELKDRFKVGSIPLQTDFSNLIDVAEHGRKAVGKSAGQTGPAEGFTLSETGRLELKLNAGGGIKVDKDGIGLKPEQTFPKGMVMMFAGTETEMPAGWALCDGQEG
ncbi:hypothetical protein [Serratia sp. 2723]|uniref:hypothetical protein n=1 Tax=unclassified Serratia (in: enterobacteria) TaxID=2647522 RepID=UPI003D1B44F3